MVEHPDFQSGGSQDSTIKILSGSSSVGRASRFSNREGREILLLKCLQHIFCIQNQRTGIILGTLKILLKGYSATMKVEFRQQETIDHGNVYISKSLKPN